MSDLKVELLPIEEADLPLYELMFTDPIHMAELGGPQPAEKVPSILAKQLEFVSSGKGWVFKIYAKDVGTSVGNVMIWRGCHEGNDIVEMGWGVHHNFKNRGYGTEALRQLIQKAKDTQYWGSNITAHAFTTTTNAPSNRMCEKIEGFRILAQCDIDYDGRMLTCNHWAIDI